MGRTAIQQLLALSAAVFCAWLHSDAHAGDADRRLVWKLPVHEGVVTPPVVSEGAVFFVTAGKELFAVDAKGGQRLWSYDGFPGRSFCHRRLVVVNGIVYTNNYYQQLLALDAKTGKVLWSLQQQQGLGKPLVANGVVYVGGLSGGLWALDARTGMQRWHVRFPNGNGVGVPVTTDGALFVPRSASKGKRFICHLDAATGRTVWEVGHEHASDRTLAAGSSLLYVRLDGGVTSYDIETGKKKWEVLPVVQERPPRVVRNPKLEEGPRGAGAILLLNDGETLATDGKVVYWSANGRIYGVDGSKGEKILEHVPKLDLHQRGIPQWLRRGRLYHAGVTIGGHHANCGRLTAPTVGGGVLYFGAPDGLRALDLQACRLLWRFQTEAPVSGKPALADGVLYVGTANMKVPGLKCVKKPAALYALSVGHQPDDGQEE